MRLYLDIETGVLSLAAGGSPLARIEAKQRDLIQLEVFPSSPLPQGTTGVFACKETYGGVVLAIDASWDAPVQSGAGYVFAVNLNTVELDALFAAEVSAVKLRSEIRWEKPDGSVRRSATFDLVVNRAVYLTGDGQPDPAGPEWPLPGEIVTEAPQDGKSYVRKDGAWVEIPDPHIFRAPDDEQWRVGVTNEGVLETTKEEA